LERFEHGGDIYSNNAVRLDFSVNTNPFGLPDAVRDALVSHVDEFINYPDPLCRELCAAIASYENVQAEWILCGNGAADLIYRLCFALKPRCALVCAPTFSEYERALEQVGSRIIYHNLTEENGYDLKCEILDMINTDLDMIFLCHPNNPTGRLIPDEIMERIMQKARRTGTTVIVDECFLDFTTGKSAKRFLQETPELILLKAFTKTYAMAGLRLGYIVSSNAKTLSKISSVAQCWSVSVPAQIAGVVALTDKNWHKKTLHLIKEERAFLTSMLKNLGITVFHSDSNYILIRSDYPLKELLLKKGILIRHCENFKGLDSSYYRISIKKRHENEHLTRAIEEIKYE